MTLLEFLNSKTTEDQAQFARACGTTIGYLRLIAYGKRRCGESLAINIDRESSGQVSLDEMRPDVDWEHVRAMGLRQDSTHA